MNIIVMSDFVLYNGTEIGCYCYVKLMKVFDTI